MLYSNGTRNVVDVVVGADGLHSQVRPHVLSEDVRPVHHGQAAFRRNIPPLPEIDRITPREGPKGMAGFMPIGLALAYGFYTAAWDQDDQPDPGELDVVLRERMAPFGELVGWVRDEYVDAPSAIVLRSEE